MDLKQKAILFLGGGILIVLIVFFFTSGNEDRQEVTEENDEEMYQYSDSNDVTDKNENDSSDEDSDIENKDDIHINIALDLEKEDHVHDEGEYDYDYVKDVIDGNIEMEVDEDLIPKTADDIYDKKELEKAKKVAEKFIKSYYDYDGDDTTAGIERAKKYMTDDLYEELLLMDEEENPVYSSFYKKLKKIKYSETFVVPEVLQETTETGIFIRYNVYAEHSNPSNKEKKDEKDVYVLALDKHGKDYLVEYLVINQPLF